MKILQRKRRAAQVGKLDHKKEINHKIETGNPLKEKN